MEELQSHIEALIKLSFDDLKLEERRANAELMRSRTKAGIYTWLAVLHVINRLLEDKKLENKCSSSIKSLQAR